MREKKSRKSLLSSFKTQLLAMSILPMLFSLLVVLIVAITGMRNLAQTMMYDKFECTSILVQNSSQDTIDAEMKAIAEEQDMIRRGCAAENCRDGWYIWQYSERTATGKIQRHSSR